MFVNSFFEHDASRNSFRGSIVGLNAEHRSEEEKQWEDFTIIWQDLKLQVDTQSWLDSFKQKFARISTATSIAASAANKRANVYWIRGDEGTTNGSAPNIEQQHVKIVLDRVCGCAKSRQLTAILGPSGAGKTSLLKCLFGAHARGASGHVILANFRSRKLHVCFIPQKDHLNECLTVREDLTFVSRLRASIVAVGSAIASTSRAGKDLSASVGTINVSLVSTTDSTERLISHSANVLHVAQLLGLTSCLDVQIRHISGGQRKRLSIGRELMAQPDVLVLDEPTTGLDSVMCLKTVALLRDLAHSSPRPMAIVCTIHQPSPAVFDLFDRTLFLSSDARVAYDGSPADLPDTLEHVAGLKVTNRNYAAPALMDICVDPIKKSTLKLLVDSQRFKSDQIYDTACLAHKKYQLERHDDIKWKKFNTFKDISQQRDHYPSATVKVGSTASQTTVCQSIRNTFILAHRSWLEIWRNPSLTVSRVTFYIGLPLIALAIFGTTSGAANGCPNVLDKDFDVIDMRASLDGHTIRGTNEEIKLSLENIFYLSFLVFGFAVNIISTSAAHYPQTRQMFKQEMTNGLYSPSSYYIGQLVADLPQHIVYPTLSIVLAYSLSGQVASYLEWRMWAIAVYFFLSCYCTHFIGLLIGAIFYHNTTAAVIVGQLILFPAIVFSGFILELNNLIPWIRKLATMSTLRHAMLAIVSARYGHNVCNCQEDSLPKGGEFDDGIPINVKNILEYLWPKSKSKPGEIRIEDFVRKIKYRFVKAQSFGYDIKSCADVQPFVVKQFKVTDDDIYSNAIWFVAAILAFKVLTFVAFRRLTRSR